MTPWWVQQPVVWVSSKNENSSLDHLDHPDSMAFTPMVSRFCLGSIVGYEDTTGVDGSFMALCCMSTSTTISIRFGFVAMVKVDLYSYWLGLKFDGDLPEAMVEKFRNYCKFNNPLAGFEILWVIKGFKVGRVCDGRCLAMVEIGLRRWTEEEV
ncbi:hypothetical protein U1Q18_008332 [Sarracenia purpurea var. burkii]